MIDFLKHALMYAGFGWSILPVGPDKKPALKSWKKYQSERPKKKTLRRWFGEATAHTGLAVVCGAVSGGLTVRDFDNAKSYRRWARAYPKLARSLPTVKTGRGFHVYFRSNIEKIINVTFNGTHEGELRGSGIVILPPSRHASGRAYAWTVPLPESGLLPFIDPVASGLMPVAMKHREPRKRRKTEKTKRHAVLSVSARDAVLHPDAGLAQDAGSVRDLDETIMEMIRSNLPTGPGQRNHCIFNLCRTLKADPVYCEADPMDLKFVIAEWHEQALKHIRTKPFEESLIDFIQGWKHVKHPKGTGPMDVILERAKSAEPLAEAMMFEQPALRLLVSVCRELQENTGDAPFFLGCRTAGRLIGVDHVTAWRWLDLMHCAGLLTLVELGRKCGGRNIASRYYYVGDTDDAN